MHNRQSIIVIFNNNCVFDNILYKLYKIITTKLHSSDTLIIFYFACLQKCGFLTLKNRILFDKIKLILIKINLQSIIFINVTTLMIYLHFYE